MIHYSIKDLENISGIKAHTLRIWEVRYKLFEPTRTDTNIRLYSNNDMRKLLNVVLLNTNGLKISKIASLSNQEICDKSSEILSTSYTFQNQIESLTISMVEMDEQSFERIVSNAVLKFGIEDTVTQIIYPFLVKVGVLWRTESINVGQEHFITNLIRQKLISAIDGQIVKPDFNSPSVLMFLPENELHEISLLFYNYLLRKKNFRVIYLGQSVPLEDVVKVANTYFPTHILSVFTAGIKQKKVVEYIQELSSLCPLQKILLTGFQVSANFNFSKSTVIFFKNSEDLLQHF